jgi:hypothetical protein
MYGVGFSTIGMSSVTLSNEKGTLIITLRLAPDPGGNVKLQYAGEVTIFL